MEQSISTRRQPQHFGSTPLGAIYVDVARAFYTDEEPRLINAVLDRIAKENRPDKADRPQPGALVDDTRGADETRGADGSEPS